MDRFCKRVMRLVYEKYSDAKVNSSHTFKPWPPKFENCKSDFERANFILDDVLSNDLKDLSLPKTAQKSDSDSKSHRELGNKLLESNNLSGALEKYTLAILCADSAVEKSLGFGNRSCVLSKLGAYVEALEDIDQAIKIGFPADRQHRLLIRRAECYSRLGQFSKALNTQESVLVYINENNLKIPQGVMKSINDCIESCRSKLKQGDDKQTVKYTSPIYAYHYDTICSPDRYVQCKAESIYKSSTSSSSSSINKESVSLINTDEMGWHLVANRQIKAGELVLLDKPYSCRISSEKLLSHCYYCFKRTINPVPCRSCTQVVFCSAACENSAWQINWLNQLVDENGDDKARVGPCDQPTHLPCHRFECGLISYLLLHDYAGWKSVQNMNSDHEHESVKQTKLFLRTLKEDELVGGPNISFLSFGTLCRTAPDLIRDLIQNSLSASESPDRHDIQPTLAAVTGKRILPKNNWNEYTSIAWLAANSEKRPVHDLWQRTVAAIFLTKCLEMGGYPLTWIKEDRSKIPASWVATCLLNHLQVISSNAHSLSTSEYPSTGTQFDLVKLERFVHVYIGNCLYPILSLLNHSCDPNVANIYRDQAYCGLYSIRPIAKGEIIWSNYGLHYYVHDRATRQRDLENQYYFKCSCKACVENWRIGLSSLKTFLRCSNCSLMLELNLTQKPSQGRCRCSRTIQNETISSFNKLSASMKVIMDEVNEMFAKRMPHEITTSFLKFALNYFHKNHDEKVLFEILARPSMLFDWYQEQLKLLLDLCYGSWYAQILN